MLNQYTCMRFVTGHMHLTSSLSLVTCPVLTPYPKPSSMEQLFAGDGEANKGSLGLTTSETEQAKKMLPLNSSKQDP